MLSDEEKKAVVYLKLYCINDVLYDNKHYEQIETVLNLIEKQSKQIEELKEGFKIQEHNYQVAMEEIEQRWEDKIKAEIEELEKEKNIPQEIDFKAFYRVKDLKNIEIKVLESLIEKE